MVKYKYVFVTCQHKSFGNIYTCYCRIPQNSSFSLQLNPAKRVELRCNGVLLYEFSNTYEFYFGGNCKLERIKQAIENGSCSYVDWDYIVND